MGRPNLSEVRTAEILDAFERTVVRFGLEGSSLERVADEAGVKRTILRHYIGNRDELILALARRVVEKYQRQLQEFFDQITPDKRVDQLLGFFFSSGPVETAEGLVVVQALISSGEQYPQVKEMMLGYVEGLVSQLSNELREAYPDASGQRYWSVAYGVVSICFNQESLTPLGLPRKYLRSARSCARSLIQTLES